MAAEARSRRRNVARRPAGQPGAVQAGPRGRRRPLGDQRPPRASPPRASPSTIFSDEGGFHRDLGVAHRRDEAGGPPAEGPPQQRLRSSGSALGLEFPRDSGDKAGSEVVTDAPQWREPGRLKGRVEGECNPPALSLVLDLPRRHQNLSVIQAAWWGNRQRVALPGATTLTSMSRLKSFLTGPTDTNSLPPPCCAGRHAVAPGLEHLDALHDLRVPGRDSDPRPPGQRGIPRRSRRRRRLRPRVAASPGPPMSIAPDGSDPSAGGVPRRGRRPV